MLAHLVIQAGCQGCDFSLPSFICQFTITTGAGEVPPVTFYDSVALKLALCQYFGSIFKTYSVVNV